MQDTLVHRLTNCGEQFWSTRGAWWQECQRRYRHGYLTIGYCTPNCRYGPRSAILWTLAQNDTVPLSTTTKSHPTGLSVLPAAIKVETDSVRKGEWMGGHLPQKLGWMNGRITFRRRTLECHRRDGPRTHHYPSRKGWRRWTGRNMAWGCELWSQWLIMMVVQGYVITSVQLNIIADPILKWEVLKCRRISDIRSVAGWEDE